MQKKPTLIVLCALLCIFGYFGWEHFKTKKNPAVINKRWSILKKQGHLKNTAIEGEVK